MLPVRGYLDCRLCRISCRALGILCFSEFYHCINCFSWIHGLSWKGYVITKKLWSSWKRELIFVYVNFLLFSLLAYGVLEVEILWRFSSSLWERETVTTDMDILILLFVLLHFLLGKAGIDTCSHRVSI